MIDGQFEPGEFVINDNNLCKVLVRLDPFHLRVKLFNSAFHRDVIQAECIEATPRDIVMLREMK
jgi:hypothetical protein